MIQDMLLNWEALFICIFILLFLVFCIVVLIIIYRSKQKIIQIQQAHEIAIMDKKIEQKRAIEELLKQERDNEWIKEKDEMKKRLDELWTKRNEVTPLDMKRVTLLYLVLWGKNEGVIAENLDKETEKIKNIYEIIKNYLKD